MKPTTDQIPMTQVVIQLHENDNVAIAKQDLKPDILLTHMKQPPIRLVDTIPAGHKITLTGLSAGEAVLRYGQVIGRAAVDLQPGQHVHTHNLEPDQGEKDYQFSTNLAPVIQLPDAEQRHFMGFERMDGRVGTRNFIAVIASVQCAAQVCQKIADHFTPERLKAAPNVDGVIALTTNEGCARPDYTLLRRTLIGMSCHPNVGGSILVGLGCEGNQLDQIFDHTKLIPLVVRDQPPLLEIQALGGAQKTIQAGISAVEELLPRVNAARRSPQPLDKLALALECGGSDSWSGITANPLVGLVSDRIVRHGGTVVLGETPEIVGAEHLLTQRAVRPEIGKQLIARLVWWKDYLWRMDASFEDNPAPGNLEGGLTNICEKSLGAVAKSGSTPLTAVYEYAEKVLHAGFVFMDTPGYDPVSVTGMVAGGCNLVLFTTGRGSVFGFKPAPSIKICTNSTTFHRMRDDMDVNAGRVIDEDIPLEILADDLLELVIEVASGKPSKSENLGLGEIEFSPWSPVGPV
jgi:altronate dehydratase